jgi:hypothetical protein
VKLLAADTHCRAGVSIIHFQASGMVKAVQSVRFLMSRRPGSILAFSILRNPDVVSSFAASIRLLGWGWVLFTIQ